MDFLTGFSWPVPVAFASAVAACRFEQGDVLYSSERAYQAWDQGLSGIGRHIQVMDPPKSTRAATSEGEGTRFSANWGSPVRFELKHYRAGRVETLRSTQGRLFSCLWKGDVSLLDDETGEASPPPLLSRELHRALHESLEAVVEAARRVVPGAEGRRLLYLSVLDRSSDASRAKAALVESRLASHCGVATADLPPSQAGIPEADRYHPSLTLRCLLLDTENQKAVRDILKGVLYAPSKAPKGSRSGGSAERFALQRHGALLAISS